MFYILNRIYNKSLEDKYKQTNSQKIHLIFFLQSQIYSSRQKEKILIQIDKGMLRKQQKMNSTLPEQLLQQIRQTYNSFSSQHYPLAISTLPQLLHSMKLQIPETTLRQLNRLLIIKPQPKFNIKQFSHIVARLIIQQEIQQEMKNLFAMMDRDGDGWVGAQDLYRIIKEVELSWTQQDIDQLMQQIDHAKVGYLTYEDLVFALMPK